MTMTVREFTEKVKCQPLNISDGDREIVTGYAGDLLSFVMGRAPSSCVWFTVMTNVNICAVATLADISLVVVCEGCDVEKFVVDKAAQQGINIVQTDSDIYSAIKEFYESQI